MVTKRGQLAAVCPGRRGTKWQDAGKKRSWSSSRLSVVAEIGAPLEEALDGFAGVEPA